MTGEALLLWSVIGFFPLEFAAKCERGIAVAIASVKASV